MSLFGGAKYIVMKLLYILKADQINARYLDIPAKKNRVNIFQYHPERFGYDLVLNNPCNLGDSLEEVIIKYLLGKRRVDIDAPISKTKHFNCVGSNIQGSYQDMTIWGSDIEHELSRREVFCQKLSFRKLDIRAVRGPLTKGVLEKMGFTCPNIFGDPAILSQ